ncbi:hypothetical protein F4679DRAFT_585286 [Xylaria curta]|nr:hypothetical protein F4679DRAFT_585286 [Xylaria curta]
MGVSPSNGKVYNTRRVGLRPFVNGPPRMGFPVEPGRSLVHSVWKGYVALALLSLYYLGLLPKTAK